jgi:hypothetical protein
MARRVLPTRLPDDGSRGFTSYSLSRTAPAVDESAVPPDVAAAIAELAGESATGSALYLRADDAILVLPPFPIVESIAYSEIWTRPLAALLEQPRVVAAFLLRLGGFTCGVFRNEALVDSKTDRRFVKNRHRKGGQSQRRFDRIREKQVHELFEKACEEAREKLGPYEDEIEHVFLGGDRLTLLAFRKECSYFERFGERLLPRILPVPGDPRKTSLDALPREIWSSDVYRIAWGRGAEPPAT